MRRAGVSASVFEPDFNSPIVLEHRRPPPAALRSAGRRCSEPCLQFAPLTAVPAGAHGFDGSTECSSTTTPRRHQTSGAAEYHQLQSDRAFECHLSACQLSGTHYQHKPRHIDNKPPTQGPIDNKLRLTHNPSGKIGPSTTLSAFWPLLAQSQILLLAPAIAAPLRLVSALPA
ncbi:hypothetical protein BU16DRAFT_568440 [Lophium mytilinum]|uniref:Uncharacterized protein n=1 Tax=Lophium mytilinum TaxID=390894 RepID=A0A6A6Q8L0_9PEZI|nr:hypothetical protein BU16DRAFT_568440 [Lophium mytilinum]